MIYRNSYFRKEVRQAYIDNKVGWQRKILLALFIGLVSFGVYFVLQTLQKSVLSDAVPEIMQPSFFSTIYIYIHLSPLFLAVYFIVYDEYLFFHEIRRNAWYVLIQMRYRPVVMILAKQAALLYSVLMIYTVGFACIILLTVFLKYNFVFAYMPTLYIAGLLDIFLLTAFSAAISLFTKRKDQSRLFIFMAVIFVFVSKTLTGVYDVLSNRVMMQDMMNLIGSSQSWYVPAAAAILIICFVITVIFAQRFARFYTPSGRGEDVLPADVTIVHINEKTGMQTQSKKSARYERRKKQLNAAFTALLVFFILAVLAFNVLIILISTATPGNEITIRGAIPYIFSSDTMQPDIMANDFVLFRKIDTQYPVDTGQIVLFKDSNIVYVERVTQKLPDGFEVDIDHYPPSAQTGTMAKRIPRSAVYGIYSGKSRWLGALILFANTIIGRILLLLVPAVLLFFRKRVAAMFRRSRETSSQ